MVEFSPVAGSKTIQLGDLAAFSANSLMLAELGEWASPVATLDHYRLRGRPFAPHPHAGFSAVAYVLEDSNSPLRSRDALGNDVQTDPGGLLWTQAASGVVHEDTTLDLEKEMHGIQLFVNLTAENKRLAPSLLQLAPADIPVWENESGDRVRIMTGSYGGLSSPVEPAEPFTFLDATVQASIPFDLAAGHNLVVFVLNGRARLRAGGEVRELESAQGIGVRGGPATVEIEADDPAQVLILSALPINEPYVRHGNAYIMNDQAGIDDAIARFEGGAFGLVEPRSD